MGERCVRIAEVGGSNPPRSTRFQSSAASHTSSLPGCPTPQGPMHNIPDSLVGANTWQSDLISLLLANQHNALYPVERSNAEYFTFRLKVHTVDDVWPRTISRSTLMLTCVTPLRVRPITGSDRRACPERYAIELCKTVRISPIPDQFSEKRRRPHVETLQYWTMISPHEQVETSRVDILHDP